MTNDLVPGTSGQRNPPPNASASPATETRSAYQQAIEATTDTIAARARHHRNLVVAVAIILPGIAIAALVMWSWHALLGVGVIVPLYGAFAISDARLVLAWQQQILDLWTENRVDLKPLRNALNGYPGIPARTLNGMLTMLPLPASAGAAELRATALRKAVAFIAGQSHLVQQVQSLLTAAARMVAIASVVAAILLASLVPLLGLLAVPVLFALSVARMALAQRRWRAEIAAAREAGFSNTELQNQLGNVECGEAFARFIRLSSRRP